jgi:hypothetical protein
VDQQGSRGGQSNPGSNLDLDRLNGSLGVIPFLKSHRLSLPLTIRQGPHLAGAALHLHASAIPEAVACLDACEKALRQGTGDDRLTWQQGIGW